MSQNERILTYEPRVRYARWSKSIHIQVWESIFDLVTIILVILEWFMESWKIPSGCDSEGGFTVNGQNQRSEKYDIKWDWSSMPVYHVDAPLDVLRHLLMQYSACWCSFASTLPPPTTLSSSTRPLLVCWILTLSSFSSDGVDMWPLLAPWLSLSCALVCFSFTLLGLGGDEACHCFFALELIRDFCSFCLMACLD